MMSSHGFGKYLRSHAALATLVALSVAPSAFAGSIVINDSAPDVPLQLRDDAGRVRNLRVTWNDLQLIAKVKAYLSAKHGDAGKNHPYMVDRVSQTVSILVDRSTDRYETVPFSALKDF